MNDNTLQFDIFKLVSLRPAVSVEKKNKEINYIHDTREPEETPVGKLTKEFNPEDGSKIPDQVKEFIRSNEYDLNFAQDNIILYRINDFVTHIDRDNISNEYLLASIQNIIDTDLYKFYENEGVQKEIDQTWDRYYAFYMLGRTEQTNLDNLTRILRTYHFIYLLIKNIAISDEKTLNNILTATPLIPKLFTDLPKPKIVAAEAPKKEELNEQKVKEYKSLWADLVDTHRAMEEIKNIRFDTNLITETKNVVIPNKETGKEEEIKLTSVKSSLVVNKVSFEELHGNTKEFLRNINFSESNLQQSDAVARIQNKLEKINLSISNIDDARFMSYMPEEAKLIRGISLITSRFNALAGLNFPIFALPTNIRSSIKPLGIGDLKVVKQKLKKYVAGEVAHIENVLRGEYKERKHRVLDRTEDIFTVSNETDEETTKDLQTTERFELKKESEKIIEEQMSMQAGVTVSGSYGMVTFGAHGDFAYSTASKESNKSASNFAREVIDKSVSKIQKKTKEERTTKKLHEVEEINTHGIDNKDKPDHVTGIYRWVDKHYEAQVYNYGVRMMFEFIIPEPAAFYEYALNAPKSKKITPPDDSKLPKTPKDITRESYLDCIAAYNVQGILPPPIPRKTISTSIVKDGMPFDGNAHIANSKELVVPDGYISKVGIWFDCSAYWKNYPRLEITIGNRIFRLMDNNGALGAIDNNYKSIEPFHWFYEGYPIQVSVNSYDIASYTLNAYAAIDLTDEAFQKWQIQTFEKIMAAYKALQIEYEQKVAAQEYQAGVAIHGQNPAINREIEKIELKKSCIKMLMDTYLFGTFDATKQDKDKDGNLLVPDFDIFDALDEGKTIQFFEQAFEWENMTYLFYPYFWGRRDRWIDKINTYDNDPLFTKFLQAGSARVVIPVPPAYNDAVMYFLENNGAIWKGGETPRLNDPMFISIAEELRNQTDDLGGAKPEGEPWEIVLPTTLVYLQKDSELPIFNA